MERPKNSRKLFWLANAPETLTQFLAKVIIFFRELFPHKQKKKTIRFGAIFQMMLPKSPRGYTYIQILLLGINGPKGASTDNFTIFSAK